MTRLAEFMAARWAESYPEPPTPGHTSITEQMIPDVCQRIPEGSKVLDVGCGQGVALEIFARQKNVQTVTGTTLNKQDMEMLYRKGFGCKVWFYAMEDMPSDWTSLFDLVWARHVLEHSVAPLFALHEFKRVLKPNGWLYVEVPAPDTACCHEGNINHYSVFGDRAWQSLLEKAGFAIAEGRIFHLETPAGPDKYFAYVAHVR